ncbi:sugar ABC transporter substrate-binding protein [Desulfosporosinus fructosivorans]
MKLEKRSRILSMGIILVMFLSLLAGCSQKQDAAPAKDQGAAGNADKTILVGVTMESLEGFLAYVGDGMNAYSKEHPNVKVTVQNANHDVATQIKQVESFINQGVKTIVVKAVDKDATGPITDMCKKAGIKLIAVNVDFSSAKDVYVGSDHKYSGQIETEYVAKLLNGKGNVAILMGDPSHDAAQARTSAAKEVIAKNPGMKVVAEQTGMWNRDKGMAVAENWIQSGKQIDAVIANNDEMAIGAILAYKAAGKKIVIAGIDATKDGLDFLKQGLLSVTVFQDGYNQGYKAIEAADKLVSGQTVPSYVDVPYQLVEPAKADEYLAKYK